MTLCYKDDWNDCKEIHTGWINHKVNNRWALGLTAPRSCPLPFDPVPELPAGHRERWLDYRTQNAHYEKAAAENIHLGAIFPSNTAYLGPGSLNAFLGCEIDFQKETLWYRPISNDPEKVDRLAVDKEGFYWKWTVEALKYIRARSDGRFLTAMPDLVEGLDILSELFGTQEMLMHLIDCPDAVHRLLDQLDDLYFNVYDELADIIRLEDGSISFMAFNVWSPGRCAKIQCDFSAMISPAMFDEFVLPHLIRQCDRLDCSVYHLDGPTALCHLDSVLRIPSLTAVQWEPGAGRTPSTDREWWKPVWEKVYRAGKSAFMRAPIEQVEPFVKEFGQAGTQILSHVESEDQARRIMDESLSW